MFRSHKEYAMFFPLHHYITVSFIKTESKGEGVSNNGLADFQDRRKFQVS